MRKVLFWIHLSAGIVAGLFILMMCVTGVLLTFAPQMLNWMDRGSARVVPPPDATRLPLADLIARQPKAPAGITVHSDPAEPVELLAISREQTVYVNPYTGALTGRPSKRAHEFVDAVRNWHQWIALGPAAQKATIPIYDAANCIFLVLIISGPFLWWPKKLSWRHVRPILWFRSGISGKARDFNWHNAIGVWTFIPLLLIAATGVVLSYPWATGLLYQMTGTKQPDFRAPTGKRIALPAWQGVDGWVARAESRLPGWRTISVRNVPIRTVSLSVDAGNGGQPLKRYTLTMDRITGQELKWEPLDQNNLGFELRLMARVIHTGEVGGGPVQALAGLFTLGGAFLVYTGIALSLRRLSSWRQRRARSAPAGEASLSHVN